jgi:hypothetical protein
VSILIISHPEIELAQRMLTAYSFQTFEPQSTHSIVTMSFLFGGQPKMSSEQKIAAAETEVEMISDMFNRCVLALSSLLAA